MANGGSMRAVSYDGYGRELKHVEIPVPSPNKDEVLLKLEAASINPIDWKLRDGLFRPFLPPKFPYVPGTDISGEIVEVGPGVTSFRAGDKVVCKLSALKGGALADYAIATVDLTVHRPPNVSPAEGAALPVAAGSALEALKHVGTKFDGTGKPANVLITAASGGVGHYAVQLAKLGNLHVTATCGARNLELVKSLGADEVLDYKTPEGESLRSPSGRKYDFIIDCTHGLSWSILEKNLSANGTVIHVTPTVGIYLHSAFKKITFSKTQIVPFMLKLQGDELEFLVELAKEEKLKTVINSRHPLSKAEEAWDLSIKGHATGKIIVEM